MDSYSPYREYLPEDFRRHPVTWKMVCAWAWGLAFRSGCQSPHLDQADYEQAIHDLEAEQEIETGLL